MDKIDIAKLIPDRWDEYKNLRLRALKSDPEAYGLLYDEALKKSEEEWRTLLEQADEGVDHWIFFAKLNGELVGMVSARITIPPGDGDTVKVGEVYVAREARGKGISKMLFQRLLSEITKNPKWKYAKVKVFTSQEPAIELYKSFGFKIKEQITEDWPDGRTHETFVMEKFL